MMASDGSWWMVVPYENLRWSVSYYGSFDTSHITKRRVEGYDLQQARHLGDHYMVGHGNGSISIL